MLWSPTIRAALLAGTPWLDVYCPGCGTSCAIDLRTLDQVAVFNASPDGDGNGIWQGGSAPAVDAAGNLYLTTGNGLFDADSGGRDRPQQAARQHCDPRRAG